MSQHRLTLLVPTFLAVGCGYPSHWVEDSRSFEFEPTSFARLQCNTHNGSIRTTVAPGADPVRVIARIRAGGSSDEDARRALAAIQVSCDVHEDALVLGWQWASERDLDWDGSVGFDVTLAGAVPTEATSHNGAISIVASGTCRVATHNGEIELTGDASDATVTSHNGAISVVARGTCRVETHNGAVRLTGDISDARVTSHNGAISIDSPLRHVEASAHNGSVHVRRAAGGRLDGAIVTHGGAVVVELGPDADTRFEARTSGGRIETQLRHADLRWSGDDVSGTLGGGTGRMRIATERGQIQLRSVNGL